MIYIIFITLIAHSNLSDFLIAFQTFPNPPSPNLYSNVYCLLILNLDCSPSLSSSLFYSYWNYKNILIYKTKYIFIKFWFKKK